MALTCRVQYLNDCDPFEYLTHYPEPPRPPVHTFSCSLPLVNQIAAVHRLLKAPHRVSAIFHCEYGTKWRDWFVVIEVVGRAVVMFIIESG